MVVVVVVVGGGGGLSVDFFLSRKNLKIEKNDHNVCTNAGRSNFLISLELCYSLTRRSNFF